MVQVRYRVIDGTPPWTVWLPSDHSKRHMETRQGTNLGEFGSVQLPHATQVIGSVRPGM